MPPPIHSDSSDSPPPVTNPNGRSTSRMRRAYPPWLVDSLSNRDTHAATEEHLPASFIVSVSSHDSDSDNSSISPSESSSSERRFTHISALSAFRRRYGELQIENAESAIARAIESSNDLHLSDSDDSITPIELEVRNYATNSESDEFDTTDESVVQHGNATQSDESFDASGSSPELPASTSIPSISRRLLLSSARQNLTIEDNTDVRQFHAFYEDPLPFSGGIPLRRQNAIRGTSFSSQTGVDKQEIDSLRKNMRCLLRAIKAADASFGACPLFNDFHVWNDELFSSSQYCCPRHEDLFLELDMGSLLLNRDLSRRRFKARQLEQTAQQTLARNHSKRKCSFESSPSKKRKKIGNRSGVQENYQTYLKRILGESISENHLSDSNKNDILKGLPSSFLKSGSTFIMNIPNLQLSSSRDMEMIFGEVSHETSLINGVFKPAGINSRENLRLLKNFMSMLVGSTDMEDGNALQDVVCKTFADLEAFVQPDCNNTASQIGIPFTGNIIDFHKKDLRFLEEKKNLNAHARNDRILFQMGEWLKVRPFSHLSETFFLKQLRFGIRSLRNFSDIPKRHQKEIYEFCKNIIDQSSLLTKNFESIRSAKIPIIEESLLSFEKDSSGEVRDGKHSRFGESPFMRKWKSEVCGKLGEFACCADSCLLNLQLNYVLFTVNVNLSATLDLVFRTLSKLLPVDYAEQFLSKWHQSLKDEKISTKVMTSTLICSIERRTGRLELLKTKSEAEFKIPISRRRYFSFRRPSHIITTDESVSSSLNLSNGSQSGGRDRAVSHAGSRKTRLMHGIPKKSSPVSSFGEAYDKYDDFV